MGKFIQGLPIVILILLCASVSAIIIPTDQCRVPSTISETADLIIMESGCYQINFTKVYNSTPIKFLDKYNKDAFDLKLYSLLDVNTANANQRRTTSFESIGMNASIEANKVHYTSPDGKIVLTYQIINNSVKAGIKVTDWVSQYPTGRLELRTRIHKEDTASSHFINQPAVVDGIEQPLVVSEEVNGVNKFYVQTLFTGNSFTLLEQDPLYVVDYSPIPASHLITGRTRTGADSTFQNQIDIHSQISDNMTMTTFQIHNYIETKETWETGTFSGGSEWTAPNWTPSTFPSPSECYITNLISPLNSTYHLEIRGSPLIPCNLYRSLNLSNSGGANLTFWAKANALEVGDYCYVTLFNSTHNITLWNITDGMDDLVYRQYSINLTPYGMNTDSKIYIHTNGANLDDRCYFDNLSIKREYGNGISARWSEVFDAAYLWTLHLYSTTGGTQNVSLFAYSNSDLLSSVKVSKNLAGTGWFDINVSPLMDFEKNTSGLAFTQIRLTSEEPLNISEVFLRKEVNDTESPIISECYVTPAQAGCLDEIEFDCKVRDNIGLDYVIFTINGVNHTAEQYIHMDNTTHYEVYMNPTENTTSTIYTLSDVYAKDIVGLTAQNSTSYASNYSCIFEDYINITHNPATNVIGISNTSATIQWTTSNPANTDLEWGIDPNNLTEDFISAELTTLHSVWLINLNPETTYYYNITSSVNPTQSVGIYNFTTLGDCASNWIQDAVVCLTNDTYLITYTDQNSCSVPTSIPIDNGTYGSCNYCDANLQMSYTGSCFNNGTEDVRPFIYQDTNYFSCCALTGIVADCPTDYSPYNETYYESCVSLITDFQVDYDSVCEFDLKTKDKCYWNIFLNGTTGEYRCLSYIRTQTDNLVQTNPVYTAKSDTLLTLSGSDYEDRTHFIVNDGMGIVYFTKENLIIDNATYIFSVKCSNGTNTYQTDKAVNVQYSNLRSPVTRGVWAIGQAPFIMFLIVSIVVIMFIIAIIWGIHKRNTQ